MTEEAKKKQILWDIPRYLDCARWSLDGMLAVETKEAVTVFIPKFENSVPTFSPHWLQLLGGNELPPSTVTPSDGSDCAFWLKTTFSQFEERQYDVKAVCVSQIDWSPPGVGNGQASFLAVRFSDGNVVVLGVSSGEILKHERLSAALFGLRIVWNVSLSLSEVQNSQKEGPKTSHRRAVTAMRWHQSLITQEYEDADDNRMAFALATDDGVLSLWEVTSSLQSATNQNLSSKRIISHELLHGTVATSLVVASCTPVDDDEQGQALTVIVGTAAGRMILLNCCMKTKTAQEIWSYQPSVIIDRPIESMNVFRQETNENYLLVAQTNMKLVIGEFGNNGSIVAEIFHYVNSEDLHANIISSVSLISSSSLVECASDAVNGSAEKSDTSSFPWASCFIPPILPPPTEPSDRSSLTFISSSLDGKIAVWTTRSTAIPAQQFDLTSRSSSIANSKRSQEKRVAGEKHGHDRGDRGAIIITEDVREKRLEVSIISEISRNDDGAAAAILGLTADPLGLTFCKVKAISPDASGSREVQMNVRLKKPHCDVTHILSPRVSKTWAIDVASAKSLLHAIVHRDQERVISSSTAAASSSSSSSSSEGRIQQGAGALTERSFVGLPSAWSMSMGEVLDRMPVENHCPGAIFKPDDGEEADNSSNDDDDDDDDDDDESDDETHTKGKSKRKSSSSKVNKSGSKAAAAAGGGGGGFSIVCHKVSAIQRTIFEEIVVESVRVVVTAAANLAADVMSTLTTETEWYIIPDFQQSFDTKTEEVFGEKRELFHIPFDSEHLHRIVLIWRFLHVLVLTARRASKSEATRGLCQNIGEIMRRQIQLSVVISSLRSLSTRFLVADCSAAATAAAGASRSVSTLTKAEINSALAMTSLLKRTYHSSPLPASLESLVATVEDRVLGERARNQTAAKQLKSSSKEQDSDSAAAVVAASDTPLADVETCSVCSTNLPAAVSANRDISVTTGSSTNNHMNGEYRYTRCENSDCGTLHQRCCITLRLIGLNEVASDQVKRCSMCDSIVLFTIVDSGEDNKELPHEHAINNKDSSSPSHESASPPFSWRWWSRHSALCPYCGIIMQ